MNVENRSENLPPGLPAGGSPDHLPWASNQNHARGGGCWTHCNGTPNFNSPETCPTLHPGNRPHQDPTAKTPRTLCMRSPGRTAARSRGVVSSAFATAQ